MSAENAALLGRIAASHYGKAGPQDAPAYAARLVRHAEAGTLSHTDSLVLGAFSVAALREVAAK